MFKGLEHTAIASPNPETLAKWYVDHLEFHINYTYAGNYFVKATNGSMLEIIPSEGARGSNQMKDPGIRLQRTVNGIRTDQDGGEVGQRLRRNVNIQNRLIGKVRR